VAGSGALGSAGLGALTFGGEAKEWKEFGKDQLVEGGIGAVGGAVIAKAAPLASKGAAWVAEKIPAVGSAGRAVAKVAEKAFTKAKEGVEKLVGPYEGGALGRVVEAVDEKIGSATRSVVQKFRSTTVGEESTSITTTVSGAEPARGVLPAPSTGAGKLPVLDPHFSPDWKKIALEEFDVVPYGVKAPGFEKHHGVLDVWAKENIPGYVSRAPGTPTVVMQPETHSVTKTVYRDWVEERTGRRVGGAVDWKSITPQEAQAISEKMFDAAKVPTETRELYYRLFNQHIHGQR
jgi:hypothetical protein